MHPTTASLSSDGSLLTLASRDRQSPHRNKTSGGPHRLEGLHVLAFCDYFSRGSSGGAERVCYELYRRFVTGGARVTLVTSTPRHRSSSLQEDVVDGIRLVTFPCLDLSSFTGAQAILAPKMFMGMKEVVEAARPHVLHAHGLHFQSSLAALQVHLQRRIPLVTTAHVAGPEALSGTIQWMTRAYEHTVGRGLIRRSSRLIAVSPAVRDHLISLGASPGRVEEVFNGVDHSRFTPNPSTRAHRPRIVFIGRLISNKGPQLLLEAAIRLLQDGIDFTVDFFGEGPMRRELEARAVRAGAMGCIRFHGHTPDVADKLAGADVLVRPSLTEGMSLGVLEGLASGVCIVASDVPGNSHLLEEGRSGLLFAAGSIDALAERLDLPLRNPELRGRVAAAGLRRSRAFSWDGCFSQTADVLLRMANNT